MTNPITKLKLWYNSQAAKPRAQFKDQVIERAGIDQRTFYRYLDNEPPKLVRELISDLTKIPKNELYQTI